MNRTAVNPSSWSVQLGFDQAELVEGHRRELICSAQDAVDDNGNSQHPDDMAAQVRMSLEQLEELLGEADMTLADVVRLNFYTTDMDALLQHFTIVNECFASTGVVSPPLCSASPSSRRRTSSSRSRQPRWIEPTMQRPNATGACRLAQAPVAPQLTEDRQPAGCANVTG